MQKCAVNNAEVPIINQVPDYMCPAWQPCSNQAVFWNCENRENHLKPFTTTHCKCGNVFLDSGKRTSMNALKPHDAIFAFTCDVSSKTLSTESSLSTKKIFALHELRKHQSRGYHISVVQPFTRLLLAAIEVFSYEGDSESNAFKPTTPPIALPTV